MKKITAILFLVCICLFCNSSLAYSEVQVVLKLDGIAGESVVEDHEGEIDVLSWRWQISATSSMHVGGGGGVSTTIIRPVIITKYIDKASPHMALALLNGNHISSGVLTVRKSGVNPVDYAQIKMWNVQFVNVSPTYDSGDSRVIESVAMTFSKVCYAYTPLKEDGTGDAIIERCFNIETNMEE